MDITNNKLYIQAGGELIAQSDYIPDTTTCQLIDLSSIVDTFGDDVTGYVTGIGGQNIARSQYNGYTAQGFNINISNKYISVDGTGFGNSSESLFNFQSAEDILLSDNSGSSNPYMTINVTKFADGII